MPSRNDNKGVTRPRTRVSHFCALMARRAQIIKPHLVYALIEQRVNRAFQMRDFARRQVKLEDAFLYGRAETFERFEQSRTPPVIGNVISQNYEHRLSVVGCRLSVVGGIRQIEAKKN